MLVYTKTLQYYFFKDIVEKGPVDLGKLAMQLRALGHPVSLRIVALLNDVPQGVAQGTPGKEGLPTVKPIQEQLPE